MALMLVLAGCGGGGVTTSPLTLTGKVIDGYISGANVCLDLNGNGVCDSDEPRGTSGAGGSYSITVPVGTSLANKHLLAVVPAGAIDADAPSTPISAPYTMLSPVDMPEVISPLTTAVSTHMIADGMNVANARIRARSDLNLPIAYDFLKDHVAANDQAAINMARVMAAILSNSVGGSAPDAAKLAQALNEAKSYAVQATTASASTITGLVSGLGPAAGGFTRSCGTVTSKNCLSFSEATMALDAFEGLGSAAVVADPLNGANRVARLVKVSTGQPWAGATLYTTASDKSVPAIGFAASKLVTLRVYGSTIGDKINLKAEDASDPTKSIEAFAFTTKANEWETLTFDFTSPAAGTYNSATTYNRISIFPKFLSAVTSDSTYYFDELSYAKTPGITGKCSNSASTNCLGFDESGLVLTPFTDNGTVTAQVDVDPLLNSNKVLKVSKGAGTAVWAGVTIATSASDNSVARAGFDTSKIVTLRAYSPAAGQKIRLKFENAADPTQSVEVDATTTRANDWETLSFDFGSVAPGTAAYAAADTYNKVSVFPNFGTSPAADAVYYFDELSYATYTASGGGGGVTPSVLTFSSGFASATATVEGGQFGGYSGSSLDNYGCSGDPAWCGSGGAYSTGSGAVPAGDSAFYYYYQTPSVPLGSYVGIYVAAPGLASGFSATANNSGITLNGQTSITFKFAQNPEWFSSSGKNFAVMLTTGTLYATDCHIKLLSIVTPTAADPTSYTIPLSTFTVSQNCGQTGVTNAATALAGRPISQIDFQADSGVAALSNGSMSTGANTTVQANGVYPSTLKVVGAITFQ